MSTHHTSAHAHPLTQAAKGPTRPAPPTAAPTKEAPAASPTPSASRHIRWFVAAHLVAVGGMFAVAWQVGGGWSSSMPPIESAQSTLGGSAMLSGPGSSTTETATAVALPLWSRSTDVAAPWEGR